MNDPHVVSLWYRVKTAETVSYHKPPAVTVAEAAYDMTLVDDVLTVTMKEHHPTVGSAMARDFRHPSFGDFRHPSFGIVCPQPFIHGSHGHWKTTLSGGFRGAQGGCLTLLSQSSGYARGDLHVRPCRRCGYNLDELSRFALGEAELAKDRGVSS